MPSDEPIRASKIPVDEPVRASEIPVDEPAALPLAAGFGALVVLTFGLIVLGALVRAHDAGLACPDWPLCFGQWIPEINLRVGFEWTHRLVAGSVALLFVGLSALALRQPATRAACARPLALSAVLLFLQVLLGALTVWQLLAAWTVTAHLVTGNAFAGTLLWTALALRDRARGTVPGPRPPCAVRRWLALTAILLAVQMVLGGLVASRYAGLACPDWPSCRAGVWFPSWTGAVGLQLLHRINGYALLAALGGSALAVYRGAPTLRRLGLAMLLLGVAQVLVGATNVLLSLPVEVTGLHSALAAALVLGTAAAVRESWFRRAAA
jgi:cytochrome c oxidase assembly protein subunit 15